ncbi:hypothetical protein HYW82_03420 [Candidatus Peregrinibacteria bacterium]|nr:hypothetical protein [Candidatus Peregrinibacteria bacterium]
MEELEKKLWKRVWRYCRFLRFVPFLRMVAVCNNLAFGRVRAASDIDLFIVAREGHLFTVRIFVTAILHIFGVRRHGEKIAGRFCLSFFVDDSALDLSTIAIEKDIYLAYWVKNLVPIIDDGVYGEFLRKNEWVDGYFEEGEILKQVQDDTKQVQDDTKQVQDDTKQVQDDTKQVQDDTKQVQDDTKQVQDDTKQVQDDTKQVQDDTKQVQDDTKQVQDDTKQVQDDTKQVQDDTKQVQDDTIRDDMVVQDMVRQAHHDNFEWIFGKRFEKIMKKWQMKRAVEKRGIAGNEASLVITDHMLKFHNIDRRRQYRNEWFKRYGEAKISREKFLKISAI